MSVHAEPPPPVVSEPKDYQYATGAQLGKGGFAICHRAELLEQRVDSLTAALQQVRGQLDDELTESRSLLPRVAELTDLLADRLLEQPPASSAPHPRANTAR